MYRNVSLRILSTFTSGVGVLSFPRVAMCMLALWTHDLYDSFPWLFSFPSLPLCPTACLCLWRVFTSIRAEIYVRPPAYTFTHLRFWSRETPPPKSVFRFVSSPTLHLTYFHPRFSCAPFNFVLFSSHRPRATPVSPQPPDLCFVVSPVTVNKHHSLQIPGVCVFCFLGPPA